MLIWKHTWSDERLIHSKIKQKVELGSIYLIYFPIDEIGIQFFYSYNELS